MKNTIDERVIKATYYCKMEVDINNRTKKDVTKNILKSMDQTELSKEHKQILNKVLANLKSGGYYVG